jgi:hypothetical protein
MGQLPRPRRWQKNVKIKAVPYYHIGSKVERKYSSYSFLTSALDGDE